MAMKKIYYTPEVRVINFPANNILVGSDTIEITNDKASHDTEVLSKESTGDFEWFEEE